MADSLNPWLLPYLTEIAEKFGAQTHTVPPYEKKKKVQITEFLTYGFNAEFTYIWARVAEKEYSIPIKFSQEAVAEFESTAHSRLTQCKGAIVTIKKFKPMFTRLPDSNGGKSSFNSYLALECDYVSLLGSAGESIFGNPKPITSHPDMQLWSQGLNEPGGAGNVLKERKQGAETRDKVAESWKRQSLMPPPAAPPPPDVVVKKAVCPLKSIEVTNLETYRAKWQIVEKNPAYRHPPWQNEGYAVSPSQADDRLAGSSSGVTGEAILPEQADDDAREREAESAQSPKSRATTPLELHPPKQTNVFSRSPEIERSPWPRSRSGTPFTSWEVSSPAVKSSADDTRPQATNNTSLAPPTPAQRVKHSINTPDLTPSSPYPFGNESIADIEPHISSSQAAGVLHIRPVVPRRVPRPTSPQPRRTTGPELVLVPNSDTSGTQSQSLTQYQSQSQSQSRLQVQAEVSSSRLMNEEMEMDIDETNVKKTRKRSPFRAKSDSSSPRGVRSKPAKWVDGNGRVSAEGTGSSSRSDDGDGGGDEYEDMADENPAAPEGEDDYPWMSLRSIREIIAKRVLK